MFLLNVFRFVWRQYCKIEEVFIVAIMIFMVFTIGLVVVFRLLPFRNPIWWGVEISILCFFWVTFLSAGLASKTKRHIRIEILEYILPPKYLKYIDLITSLMISAFLLYMIYIVGRLVIDQHNIFSRQLRWRQSIFSSSLLVGSLIMFVRYIEHTVEEFKSLFEL